MDKIDRRDTTSQELAWQEHLERVCLRNLLASTNEAIYFKDLSSRFLLVSRGVVEHHIERETRNGSDINVEIGPDYFVGKTDLDLFPPSIAEPWIAEEREIAETGQPILDILERDATPDSQGGWFRTSKGPLLDDDGTVIGTFGISRDVTAQVKAELELVRREAQLRALIDSSPDAIACYNQDLRYEFVNAKAVALLGTASEQVIGRTDQELGRPPEVIAPLLDGLRAVLQSKQMCEVEYTTELSGVTSWWHARMVPQLASDGSIVGVIAATRDLSEIKEAQSVLAHQALHDPLTGVSNRLALIDRMNRALAELQRNPGRLALFFIDLDNFKLINDARGHDVGDRLLIEVAARLTRVTRRVDTVARLGGDEFVMLFDHLSSGDDAHLLAARVLRGLSRPFIYGAEKLSVTASIGVVVSADPDVSAGDLLRDADIAMYRAKERGKDRIEVFNSALRDHSHERNKLAVELRQAVEEGQFFLAYQPFFSLGNNSLVGVEALVRWQHPRQGVVAPVEFIALAEELGLINALGAWVLDEACRQMSRWNLPDDARRKFLMSVNVSTRQLTEPGFVDVVAAAMAKHQVAPSQLCLEITESGMTEEFERCQATVEALSTLGVRLSLDDFGTGYSSLANLHRFRVNTVKIDRSFIERLGKEGSGGAMVAGVVAMAHSLGMDVVAEGVETEEQRRQVAEMDCDEAQGFLFARPLSAELVSRLIVGQQRASLSA